MLKDGGERCVGIKEKRTMLRFEEEGFCGRQEKKEAKA